MPDPFTADELEDLVSPTDLLDLQTVVTSPAALSMLRKRHDTFPKPRAVAGRSPLFRLADVVDWFEDERKVQLAPRHQEWRLARAIKALQVDHRLEDARQFAIGVVATCGSARVDQRRRLERGGDLETLYEVAGAIEPDQVRVAVRALLDAIDHDRPAVRFVHAVAERLAGSSDPIELEREIIDGLASIATSKTTTSPDLLIDLMVAVADLDGADTIFDPTCGEAGLLLAAGSATGRKVQLAGMESDRVAWNIAHARAHLRGLRLDLGDGPATSQLGERGPGRDAALVVCDPPFVGRGYVRWLNHALHNSRYPDGRAVICLPARTLEPRQESRHIPFGAVEAVVACPPVRDDTGEPVAIWSITRRPNNDVLIIDATGRDVTPDALSEGLRHWRSTGTRPPGIPSEVMPAVEAHSVGADLRPSALTVVGDDPTAASKKHAVKLATELLALVSGELKDSTTAEQRRVLERLVNRLRRDVAVHDEQP